MVSLTSKEVRVFLCLKVCETKKAGLRPASLCSEDGS